MAQRMRAAGATTVSIDVDKELWHRVKVSAAAEGIPVRAYVERLFRAGVEQSAVLVVFPLVDREVARE